MFKNIKILNCQWLDENYSNSLISISSGSYGAVFSTVDANTGKKKALKIIRRENDEEREWWINEYTNETQILKFLTTLEIQHSVKLEKHYIGLDIEWESLNQGGRPAKETSDMLFLVMELAENNLEKLIKSVSSSSLIEKLGSLDNLIVSLIQGLEPAHENKIAHRDLKPQNILIFNGNRFKIADWGISRFLKKNGTMKTKNIFGTSKYLPPEYDNVTDGVVFEANFFKADIYACGLIILEACGVDYRGQVRRNGIHHDIDVETAWNNRFIDKVTGHYKLKYKQLEQKLKCYFSIIKDMVSFDRRNRLDIVQLIKKYESEIPFSRTVKRENEVLEEKISSLTQENKLLQARLNETCIEEKIYFKNGDIENLTLDLAECRSPLIIEKFIWKIDHRDNDPFWYGGYTLDMSCLTNLVNVSSMEIGTSWAPTDYMLQSNRGGLLKLINQCKNISHLVLNFYQSHNHTYQGPRGNRHSSVVYDKLWWGDEETTIIDFCNTIKMLNKLRKFVLKCNYSNLKK